jgi:hypothetical protein
MTNKELIELLKASEYHLRNLYKNFYNATETDIEVNYSQVFSVPRFLETLRETIKTFEETK